MCTGNGQINVEASDSICNVERGAGLKHQHQAVFDVDNPVFKEMFQRGSCTDHSAGTHL